ncbi:MAG: extracellular solute-binding protein [Coleofasciculus chthonoplastes F3-SA18-01]|jgi:putative spermidine/putrescine transport system substrate-binding protein|uniref:extracellular solute-binding protein n=1 Tax=Coleofasciculus chthonoplastes TaxID=64178 RepID=UPI0032F6664C
MKRRSLIMGASALALGQLASGCGNRQSTVLNVRLLQNSIPVQLLAEFRQTLESPVRLKFDPQAQFKDIYQNLRVWKRQAENPESSSGFSLPLISRKPPAIANLVTLGDYWLESAIQQQLIQPLELVGLSGWQQLPPRWQQIVRRNRQGQLDESGLIWGAPYRWGTVVIAYRQDKFEELGWTPTDWSDLWRPELRDRISLLDSPREVIGLTLKKLGFSYNIKDLSQVPNLKTELLDLHKQVKLYSSDHYLEPLVLGDTWLAVGWSTDILSLRGRDRLLQAVIPGSGTSLWADVWVQPAVQKTAAESPDSETFTSLTQQWIDFCWRQQSAIDISLLSHAASPILVTLNQAELPNPLQTNELLLPEPSILEASEFLYPLPQEAIEQYQKLWQEIRTIQFV